MVHKKLSIDEREALDDLINSESIKALWKETEAVLQLMYADVLKYTLDGSNKEQFLILKAQCDGATKAFSALKTRLSKTKLPNK